ncbi:MAG TPA: hypothetical protein VFU85_01950, partial [Nocardioides sp.]|nr:hypothetical protein [Nocardioides sp.]
MKGSDNPFPSILIEDTITPAPPDLGGWYRLFVQGEQIKLVDHTGTVYNPTDFIQEMVSDVADDVAALEVVVSGKADFSHTQSASSITDFTEAVQDVLGSTLIGSGVTVTYNDAGGTVTITGLASTDTEAVRDAIGVALVGVGSISVTVDDAGDTITIGSAVPAPTGQPDGKVLTTDSGGLVYASPTGGLDLEAVQDAVAAMILAGTNVTKTYNDAAGTLTIDATPGGGGGGATARVPYVF